MDLEKIKETRRLSAQCTFELEPLFADDAFNWLIAEVERLNTKTWELADYRARNTMLEQGLKEWQQCKALMRADIERLTAEIIEGAHAQAEYINRHNETAQAAESWMVRAEKAEAKVAALAAAHIMALERAKGAQGNGEGMKKPE